MAVTQQTVTEQYAAYRGDCCEVLPTLKNDSIHISIYSPPFAELYNYSSSERDMSNCKNYDDSPLDIVLKIREFSFLRVNKKKNSCRYDRDKGRFES